MQTSLGGPGLISGVNLIADKPGWAWLISDVIHMENSLGRPSLISGINQIEE